MVVPNDAELETAVAGGGEQLNSTEWLGCIIAPNALMSGTVVELLQGVESAAACCRACREWVDGGCNVWNYCAQASGCK